MQSIEYQSVNQFILNGDTSPLDSDISPQKQQIEAFFKQPPKLLMSLNQLHYKRKRNIQQYTDELILFNNYLTHKFQHSEESNDQSRECL